MENLVYFLRNGKNFLKIGENKFLKPGEKYSSFRDSVLLEKDYNLIYKFFNRHGLYLEDLNERNVETSEFRVEKIILEHIVHNFPSELFGLDNLKYLDLSGGAIKSIPKRIDKLKKLEELYLDECGLENIPYELGKLNNLRAISLMDNNIKSRGAGKIIGDLQSKGIEVLI
ncbi:MAG TPA: hypothetical protein VJ895_01185 [Candidatus Nanoarchaeia archaeon]|nr:hypothetical protein [Candidatus Nanoarchaeia archaeon]